jgi:hypothetical protein
MDWASVFDEAHPQPGATDAVIEQFVAEVARPMSAAEVRAVNASQRNPFPKFDRLHSAWRPFDATAWVMPSRPLPVAYLSLLRWSNGGEFRTGERWFQFFPALCAQHGVRAMMVAYQLPQYMPGRCRSRSTAGARSTCWTSGSRQLGASTQWCAPTLATPRGSRMRAVWWPTR